MRKRRGALFVFSGVDGSGKSTQIEMLAGRVRGQGRSTTVCWARGGYTSGMLALKGVLRKTTGNRLVPAQDDRPARQRSFQRPGVRGLWLRLAILDLCWLYAVRVRCWMLFGKTVLCDRYWQDTLLDFELHHSVDVSRWWLWRLFVALCPRPNVSFLMLVPPTVSAKRGRQKREPFPSSTDLLAQRYAAYQSWRQQSDWVVIDGSTDREEIGDLVAKWVRKTSNVLAGTSTATGVNSCA